MMAGGSHWGGDGDVAQEELQQSGSHDMSFSHVLYDDDDDDDDDDRDDGLDPREPICQNLLSTCSKCTAITSRKIEQFH